MVTESTRTINIARDYSTEPAGRFPEDGDFNGQRFRKEILLPALRQNTKVLVDFDGTEGYGSSFLEEAFGGLVRLEGLSPTMLRDGMEILSKEDPSVIDEVWEYVDQATPEK